MYIKNLILREKEDHRRNEYSQGHLKEEEKYLHFSFVFDNPWKEGGVRVITARYYPAKRFFEVHRIWVEDFIEEYGEGFYEEVSKKIHSEIRFTILHIK